MFRVSFPGPFSQHDVVVNGWKVPFVHAKPHGENDEHVMLVLDNRIGEDFTVEEAERFVPFLADAIAIALGYAAHPNESTEQLPPREPHSRPVRMHMLATGDL